MQLAKPSLIHRIEMDFSYFINNNPLQVSILGLTKGQWLLIVDHSNVKAFAGNIKEFIVSNDALFEQIKILVHPDGGINRIKIYSLA